MIKTNICKINVDTDIRLAFTAGIREYLSTHPQEIDPRKYLKFAMDYAIIQIEKTIDLCQNQK